MVNRYAPRTEDPRYRDDTGVHGNVLPTQQPGTQAQRVGTPTTALSSGIVHPQYPPRSHYGPSTSMTRRVHTPHHSLIPVSVGRRNVTQTQPNLGHLTTQATPAQRIQQGQQQTQLTTQGTMLPQGTHPTQADAQNQGVPPPSRVPVSTMTTYPPNIQDRYRQTTSQTATGLSGSSSTLQPARSVSQVPRTTSAAQAVPGTSRVPAPPATSRPAQGSTQSHALVAPTQGSQRIPVQMPQIHQPRQTQSTRGGRTNGGRQGGSPFPASKA